MPENDGNQSAAGVVEGGKLSEADAAEIVRLRSEKEALERRIKERETECATLQDENSRLKSPPPPAVVEKRGFLSGAFPSFNR